MNIEKILFEKVSDALKSLYGSEVAPSSISFQKTNDEFEGDITLVVFPFLKISKKKPEDTANDIGNYLKTNCNEVEKFNVVKGFLNLVIADTFWLNYFISDEKNLTPHIGHHSTILLEFCSPNTNKPLHLGHIRNILLGWSISKILEANGHKVIKTNLVNDRGIHICKSMFAWKNWGEEETPESSGMKGDHLVGKYYVLFDRKNNEKVGTMLSLAGPTTDEFEIVPKEIREKIIELGKKIGREAADERFDIAQNNTPQMLEVRELLRKWEAGDKETMELWKKMNNWVYDGFEQTYKALGVTFDKIYYESQTYKLGKDIVKVGVKKNFFQRRADNSVVVDLKDDKLDEKVLLRADGTSVYITQDIGTAVERLKDYPDLKQMIYTVGNEQEHHFKVLFKILKKLGYSWADNCYHLSYGMVELPEGKMKSREGTVVDADDLIKEMIDTARETTKALGKIENFTNEEAENLYRIIGLAALKYFILKVDPKKKMLFNPKESIDFNGNTGPFIQYTYARIQSVLRKGEFSQESGVRSSEITNIDAKEKALIKLVYTYHSVIKEAADNYSPALIANYVYELATAYNSFYHDINILKEENEELKKFRLALSARAAGVIKNAMHLLGIEVPERM